MSKKIKHIAREKLTKKIFMALPEGAYLVSNVLEYGHTPSFKEKVCAKDERLKQWQRIVKSRVDQRLCLIFETKDDYKESMRIFFKKIQGSEGQLNREELCNAKYGESNKASKSRMEVEL